MTHIEIGRFDTLLRRFFSIKGKEASPLLSPEIQPVIVIQDDAPELDFLSGVRRYAGTGAQVGAAGEFSEIFLINPVGSGVLAVVESWEVITFGAFAANFGIVQDITLGLVGGTAFNSTDLRRNTQIASCAMRTFRGAVDNLLSIYSFSAAGVDHIPVPYGVILPPGTGVGSRSGVFDTTRANISWTERTLEQSEEG